MKRRTFVSIALPACGLRAALALSTEANAAEGWIALTDVPLMAPKAGNALDFSILGFSGAAGRHGWARAVAGDSIGFEQQGKPQRFLCASMVFSPPNGGLPGKADARRLIAELRSTGYNAVRLHYIDAALMQGRDKDFDVDPAQLARLQFLLAQFKDAGIYWVVDGMTSDNGGYGNVLPHRYVRKYDTKVDSLTSDAGFAHWAKLVDCIWGVTNPHTGLAPIADPAMLGIILVNEGSLAFMATVQGGRYPASLAAPFQAWLKARYGSAAGLRTAWGAELGDAESFDRQVKLPAKVRGHSPRDKDFSRFVVDIETAGLRRMEAHVRSRGFCGLASAFDNWGFLGADLSRAQSTWVDMHGYHSLPSNYVDPGSRVEQTSLLEGAARSARELTNSRQWGKPFTVTEYGQPFWNRFRYEISALVPALAAHHGWSLICLFAEVPIQADYGPSPFARLKAIYPFGVGADPIAHAGERLAAVLFLRGDVAKSSHRIRLHLSPDAVIERSAGWEQVPEALSRLAFVAPMGLDLGPMPPQKIQGELSVDLMAGPPPWMVKLQSALTHAGAETGADAVAQLRRAGIINAANRTQPGRQRYESDTGQLFLDVPERALTIDTPLTAVVVLSGGSISASAGSFKVDQASGPGLFAVSSLDGLPMIDSGHLLIWVLTDAINTGMTFADEQRTTIKALGKFPPVVRTISARLGWPSTQAAGMRAWALALNGERRDLIPLQTVDQGVTLAIDTAALPGGPALFFEVALA